MAKIINVESNGKQHGYAFQCPGCDTWHVFQTSEFHQEGTSTFWDFNKDMEKPTISPSFLTWWDEGEKRVPFRCHSFIKDGMIQFLGDCTHKLTNQTVPLPDIT